MSKYLLLFLLLAGSSFAWLTGWDYMTPVNISSASALTDYQIQVDPKLYNNTGLVGSWHFSEGSGSSATDSSGNGNAGTITIGVGGSQSTVAQAWSNGASGKFGRSLSFDGTDDYVDAGNAASLNILTAVTMEAWVKWTGSIGSVGYGIYAKGNDGHYFQIRKDGGTGSKIAVWFNSPINVWKESNTDVSADVWHHVAFTYDGANVRFYLDGIPDGAPAVSGTLTGGSGNALIGNIATTSRYFNGAIDELRVYNRSLSAQEISELYNASKARLDYADLRFTQPYTIYETPVPISGAVSNLTDYQVLINITNSTILSHMRSDGADLRFFSSATSAPYSSSGLSYWLENITSSQARVWVKANVSAGGSTLYMYYGNSSAASASSFGNVFDRNFSESGLVGLWHMDEGGSSQSVADSSGRGHDGTRGSTSGSDGNDPSWVGSGGGLFNGGSQAFAAGDSLDFELTTERDVVVVPDSDDWYFGNGDFSLSLWVKFESLPTANTFRTMLAQQGSTAGGWGFDLYNNAGTYRLYLHRSGTDLLYANTAWPAPQSNTWYNIIVVRSGNVFSAYVNNAQVGSSETHTESLPNSSAALNIGKSMEVAADDWGTDGILDEVRIYKGHALTADERAALYKQRKYSSPEPTATIGSESVKSSGYEASLPYWLESDKIAWVKALSLPAGQTTPVYLYYGSPSASPASNGSATFSFFDDATGVYSDKWTNMLGTGSYTTLSGKPTIVFSGNTIIRTLTYQSGDNIIIEGNHRSADNTGLMQIGYFQNSAPGFNERMWGDIDMRICGTCYENIYRDSVFVGAQNQIWATINTWAKSKVTSSAGTHYNYVNGVLGGGGSDNTYAPSGYLAIKLQVGGTQYYTDIRVRKYALPEPTASSGAEQQSDTTPPSILIQGPNASVDYSSVSVPLNFTASDSSGISQCMYELNGVNTTLAGCANATMTASSGSNSLVVWAFDGSNWGSASVSFNVSLDTIPPSIFIFSPEPKVYSAAPVPVNFVVSDASAYFCVVRLNGTINYSSCANSSLGLGNGAYILNVTANDTFGNVNSSAVSFTVDLTVSVSNSTTTNSLGIGNVSLNGIPSGASHIVYSVGSQSYSKSFSVSSGVSSVRIFARASLQGTPASGRALAFAVS